MTTLYVEPIDMAAPGSFAKRKRLMKLYAQMQLAVQENDLRGIVSAFDEIEALVSEHLRTDDGTSVADALERISADEFDGFIAGLLGAPTVPPARSAT